MGKDEDEEYRPFFMTPDAGHDHGGDSPMEAPDMASFMTPGVGHDHDGDVVPPSFANDPYDAPEGLGPPGQDDQPGWGRDGPGD